MKKTIKNHWRSTLALTVLLSGLFAASPLPAAENENAAAPESAKDDLAKRLLEFTGSKHVKIVWEGGTRGENGKVEMGVCGFDTEKGVSQLLCPAWDDGKGTYAWPRITPDGKSVVFFKHTGDNYNDGVYIVGWDGKPAQRIPTEFPEGNFDWLADVGQDPTTGYTWIYLANHGRHRLNPPVTEGTWDRWSNGTALYRVRLDDLSIHEKVYGGAGVGSIELARDLQKAIGHVAFPKIALFDLAAGTTQIVGGGCGLGMLQDDSGRFFHLEGNHRNISFYDATGNKIRSIQVNTMPAVNGAAPVFRTCASNNASFFSLRAPEEPNGQIYLGRFDKDFTKVDDWIQITDNKVENGYSRAWIEPAAVEKN